MDFAELQKVGEILVDYFLGSYVALAVVVFAFLFIYFTSQGLPMNVTTVALLPLLVAYTIGTWFTQANVWIVNIALIAIGVFTAQVLHRLYTR